MRSFLHYARQPRARTSPATLAMIFASGKASPHCGSPRQRNTGKESGQKFAQCQNYCSCFFEKERSLAGAPTNRIKRREMRAQLSQPRPTAADASPPHVWRTSKSGRSTNGHFYPSFCSETERSNRLTHYVASRNTKCAEGRTEQHYCGTAVRNLLTTWGKEYPAGKAMPQGAIEGNRDDPT